MAPLRDYLEENLKFIAREMNSAFPVLNWTPPEATYLARIDLRPLNIDDRALQNVLIEQQKSPSCRDIPMETKASVLSA